MSRVQAPHSQANNRKELLSVDKLPNRPGTQFANLLHPGGATRVIKATVGHATSTGFNPDTSLTEIAEHSQSVLSPPQTNTMRNKGWQILNSKREHQPE